VYSVKIIMDLRTVSAFMGAYRLQLYYHLPKAYGSLLWGLLCSYTALGERH